MHCVHAALELARADTHEGDAVAVVFVHVCLDFEDESRKLVAHRIDRLAREAVGIGKRRGGEAQELFQERFDAEVGERAAEEHGGELAGAHCIEVELVACAVEQLNVVDEVRVVRFSDKVGKRGVAKLGLDFRNFLGCVGVPVALEGDDAAGLAVEHAAEVLPAADRPVHRVGADAEHCLDLLHEVERVARLAVELVHECEDGDMTQRAHLEELLRLCLDALCAVDDHDRGVRSHECAVGVFRKVLVAGGIEDVHAIAVIGELQHRGGHGDTALLLDVHPIGHGVLRAGLAFDRACGLDAAGVEQELLGEGRLARVGVRDDGEGAP